MVYHRIVHVGWIVRRRQIKCDPKSQDLSPLDFFYLKSKVFIPQNTQKLQDPVRDELNRNTIEVIPLSEDSSVNIIRNVRKECVH